MAIARQQIAAGLGDTDDGLARLQFLQRQAEIHVALQVERGHVGVAGIVEPGARAQRRALAHRPWWLEPLERS